MRLVNDRLDNAVNGANVPKMSTQPVNAPAPTTGAVPDPAPAPSLPPVVDPPQPAAPPVAPAVVDPAPPPVVPPVAPTIVADPFAGSPRPPAGVGVDSDGKVPMGPTRASRLVDMIFKLWDQMGAQWFVFNWTAEIEALPGLDSADRTGLALAMIGAAQLDKDDRTVLGPPLVDRLAAMRVSPGFDLWTALGFTLLTLKARVEITLAMSAGPLVEAAKARKAAPAATVDVTPPAPAPAPKPAPTPKPERKPPPKKRGGKRRGAGRPKREEAKGDDDGGTGEAAAS